MPHAKDVFHRRLNRRTVRRPRADYGPGTTALITINCHNRSRLFGVNDHGTILYTAAGIIAVDSIRSMPDHLDCRIESSIVMPEHVHILFSVLGEYSGKMRDREFGHPVAGTIPVMINQFKGTVTRRIRAELPELRDVTIWQPRFHDRMILHGGLDAVVRYIENNPMKHYLKDQQKNGTKDCKFEDGKSPQRPRPPNGDPRHPQTATGADPAARPVEAAEY